ncbi:HTH_Tnp_Tc3_2 domain-containing protein [Trichonephila clavipes]|nr:HTH_Tnp_Tc3_2 domain-containing protein [Trichonephila clavipes]
MIGHLSNSLNCEKGLPTGLPGMFRLPKSSYNRRKPVPDRPRATTPAEDFLAFRLRKTTTVPQLVADHFQASGRRISATTVRNRLHNAGLYARRPVVCVPLNGRQYDYAGQENMFLDAATMGFCAVHRRVQIYNGSDSGRLYWKQRT